MKQKSLKFLHKQAKEAYQEWVRAKNAIEAVESEERKPILRALVGTCYRMRNSYGSGEDWWLYRTITGITDDGNTEYMDVQTDCRGKTTIEGQQIAHHSHEFDGETKITPEIFRKEVELAKQRLGI